MKDVSIIIVNYNTAAEIKLCINSIIEKTQDLSYEIIVVDNNSLQRDIELVCLQFPGIHIIWNKENEGFGKACNKACEIASGDFLFFLNPDTIIKNNAVKIFHNFWKKYQEELSISCLGAVLQDANGEDIHSFESFPKMTLSLTSKCRSLLSHFMLQKHPGVVKKWDQQNAYCSVAYITGADLFISKANFELANGFDKDFFMYFEETDLQYRLHQQNRQSYLISGPQIVHHQGLSTAQNIARRRVLYSDSMLLYFKKHSSPVPFLLFKMAWLVLDFRTLLQKKFLVLKHKTL